MALDAVAAARTRNGMNDHRHHIAHPATGPAGRRATLRPTGSDANCQMYWASSDAQMEELTIPFLGADRARLQYPFGSLARSGARLAMGSDWSVSTATR